MHIIFLQFVLLSILALVFYWLPLKPKKRDLTYMVIAFIPMWYIHSMVKVGTVPDLYNYEKMFNLVHYMSWKECLMYDGPQENGYVLLNKVVSLFTKDYYVFQGLYGFVMLSIYFWAFRKYSPYAILSIIILLAGRYNTSIYVIRQYLAVAIFVASIPLILERKMYWYLLVCLLNFTIHKTAIICLPVYFIFQMKASLIFVTAFLLSLGIYVGGDLIAMTMIESLEDYQKYLEGYQGGQSWLTAAISGFELALFVVILRKKLWTDDVIKLLFVLLLLTFFVNVAIIGKAGTVNRLSSYYGVASLFALPYMLKNMKELPLKIVILASILFLRVYPLFFGSRALLDVIDMQFI